MSNPASVTMSVPHAYLTQAAQDREGGVPLVANRRALLRVFATADEVNGFLPGAAATFFRDGVETYRIELDPPGGGIPLAVDESRLERSFNAIIPGRVLQPGVSMVVELDPEGMLPLTSSSRSRFPAEGRRDLEVRQMPPLRVTLVPVQYHSEENRDVNPGVAAFASELAAAAMEGGSAVARSVLRYARTVLPVGDLHVALREPYHTWADTSEAGVVGLIREIELLRMMEAEDPREHYTGIFRLSEAALAAPRRVLDRRPRDAGRAKLPHGLARCGRPAAEDGSPPPRVRARAGAQPGAPAHPL